MALNDEYFNSIHIDIAKKKYYNANKVDALLEEIRREALAMNLENETLRAKLAEISKGRDDISDALLSARSVAQAMLDGAGQEKERIIEEAGREKARIIEAAEKRAAEILAEAQQSASEIAESNASNEEYAVDCVRDSFERVREMQQKCIDALSEEWQRFLCGFSVSGDEAEVPEDLSEKVGAIADELSDFTDPDQ